jgi:toxin-antitoxin system PIN domain toxin
VIVADVNLLVYAIDEDSPFHIKARSWFEQVLSGTESIGLAWIVLLGFLRVTTRSEAVRNPLAVKQALELVELWLAQPRSQSSSPAPRHFELLRGLLSAIGTGGNLTSDAHLAAIAIEHGAEICSTDTDFGRFQGLRWRNPLVSSA